MRNAGNENISVFIKNLPRNTSSIVRKCGILYKLR